MNVKTEAPFTLLYIVYIDRKKLELTFSNFLTIKKIELDFSTLFSHGKKH